MSVKSGGVSTVPDLRYVPGDRRYTVAELDVLAAQTKNEIHGFQRKAQAFKSGAGEDLTLADVVAVEGLVAAFNTITDTIAVTGAAAEEQPAPAPTHVGITTVPNSVVAAATSTELTAADRELLERAVHEAGHAVAGALVGGRISRGYILPAGRTQDGVTGEVVMAEMPVGDLRGQIAYAGPWAQARFRAGGRWPTPDQLHEVMSTSGRLDRRHLCASVAGDGREVAELMDRCWPAVITVAKTLVRDGEIRHNHVVAALGLSEDESRHGFELASLRAGMRAVAPR